MSSPLATTRRVTITPPDIGPVEVTLTEQGPAGGGGHPVLVMHGGAGPRSVAAFAGLLAARHEARVLTPVHPGFDGTPRPDALGSIAGLGELYARLLVDLGLDDVTVVGNSIGGWVAAEAALAAPRIAASTGGRSPISGLVLVDAAGLALPDQPIVDFFALTMDEVAELSYLRPDLYRVDPGALSATAREAMAGNRASLAVYGGSTMADPTLRSRLAQISVPTEVVWGAADRIVPLAHGRAYADAIPGAHLTVYDDAGHLPQIETPDKLVELVWAHADRVRV